jgi:cytoskeletal protein RodZ
MFRKKPKIDPRQLQEAALQEIGTRLRQIRIEQGISLEAITKQTRIPVRLLEAIETANLDALPEPVYIRGLIKQFAEFLGLDGVELASNLPVELSLKSSQSSFNLRLPNLQLRPIHLYFLYIILVMISVRGISESLRQSAIEMKADENLPQPRPTIPQPAPSGVSPSITVKKTPNNPVVVNIQLKDQCWLKVVVDGKTEFEGILPQGTHRTWVANKQLTVRAGNAGGVLVTFNDEKTKQLGKSGQIEEVTFQVKNNLSVPE